MTTKSEQTYTAVSKPYKPSLDERKTMEAHIARRRISKQSSRIRVTEMEGATGVEPDHPDSQVGLSLLMESVGTVDRDFMEGLLGQLANSGTQDGQIDERELNFMLSMVKGIEPRDQVEAMLAAQMAAVHNATMTFAHRLNRVSTLPQQDSTERAFNRLARTFASQVEALKRYRTGEEQKVTVEHVTVNEGGQAIVGEVTTGGRGITENRRHPHEEGVSVPICTSMHSDLQTDR